MYDKAIEYNPGATPALTNIGYVKLLTGKYNEAVEWFHKGLQNDPLNVSAYLGLVYTYYLVGDAIKYEKTIQKLSVMDPGNFLVYVSRSWNSMLRKDYKLAMDEIMKPLSAMPDNVILLSGAGDIQLAMGNLTEAKKYYESVVKKDSLLRSTVTGRLPLLGLGYIMWKGGNHDGARKVFTKIVTNDQKEMGEGNERFSLPLDIACINAIEGKKDEAYKWLQKAVDAGWRYYNWAQVDPMLENLWGDEKFKTIMTFLKNDIDRMRERMMVAEKQ
jgi:tetratricopeptide (TPR) repeat protein